MQHSLLTQYTPTRKALHCTHLRRRLYTVQTYEEGWTEKWTGDGLIQGDLLEHHGEAAPVQVRLEEGVPQVVKDTQHQAHLYGVV